ncbi:MAG: C39 family peptidase [Candidatus Krumholzibacteriota bacterium]|nr:C39 family peptidase [Candidatus Krumholzibacteriota bacterium]
MICIPGASAAPHAPNHALVCMHCGTYCAPASCAMYALFTGRGAPFINQDDIYDNSKVLGGEIMGNGILETHALGMYAGTAMKPPEIQNAFTYAVGIVPFQFGPQLTTNPLLTCSDVIWCINTDIPILWIDMGSWPQDQTTLPEEIIYDSGHCKIIAGYDDLDTAECEDDMYLIYDPWPNSGSPYFLPGNQVIDVVDIYLSITSVHGTDDDTWGKIKSIFNE